MLPLRRSTSRCEMHLLMETPSRFSLAVGARMTFEQKIYRNDELLCEATVKIACLDSNRFRPQPIPSFILTEIQGER